MKPIPTEFTRNDWHHVQIERRGDFAIYSRKKDTSPAPHFELIHIRHNPERVQFGQVFPASESYPSENQWGKFGWTLATLESARSKMGLEMAKAAERAARKPKDGHLES